MEEAPENCPGTQSENAGKASACAGCPNQTLCSSGAARGPDQDAELVQAKMSTVKNKIFVLSGKGGVGKSTFSNLLARSLAAISTETNVAILDLDICGPSQPRMLGALNEQVHQSGAGWCPVYIEDNLALMSVGFLLSSPDDAVIWRGPKKNNMIKQFLTEVDWGESLDYLVLDTPPGTSDEHLTSATYLAKNSVAVLLTSPSELSIADVRREATFCRKVGLRVIGVVENMSTFVCPKCKTSSEIFPKLSGGGASLAEDTSVPFLGSVPLDPLLARACDEGRDVIKEMPDSPSILAVSAIVKKILASL